MGDKIKMEIWKDNSERTVIVPEDFRTVLSAKQSVFTFFESLAYTHKKAYVDWINDAKKEETRIIRITKPVSLLAEKKKFR